MRLDEPDVRVDDRVVLGRQAWRHRLGLDDPAFPRLDHHLGGRGIGSGDLKPDQDGHGGHHGGDPDDHVPAPLQNREQLAQRQSVSTGRHALKARMTRLRWLRHGVSNEFSGSRAACAGEVAALDGPMLVSPYALVRLISLYLRARAPVKGHGYFLGSLEVPTAPAPSRVAHRLPQRPIDTRADHALRRAGTPARQRAQCAHLSPRPVGSACSDRREQTSGPPPRIAGRRRFSRTSGRARNHRPGGRACRDSRASLPWLWRRPGGSRWYAAGSRPRAARSGSAPRRSGRP